ncbi:hypothetical protein AL060_18285 [Pseudomonas syringae pv. rhaphiolepidis]|nr:hypothetical protein AL060_18285 [Pseudomonas syringae pv. rhaphiolepidis]
MGLIAHRSINREFEQITRLQGEAVTSVLHLEAALQKPEPLLIRARLPLRIADARTFKEFYLHQFTTSRV